MLEMSIADPFDRPPVDLSSGRTSGAFRPIQARVAQKCGGSALRGSVRMRA
jgi:hypothetical protein